MDGSFIDKIIEAGTKANSGDNNWSGHDRGTTVGASEIGGCARRVFWDKQGVEHDPDFEQDWGAAERGKAIEDWFVARLERGLLAQGSQWKALFVGANQKTLVRGSQSATPDGVLTCTGLSDPGTDVYLEIKSVDPRVYETMRGPKDQHRLQTQQGMDLVRSLTPHQPQRAVLVYINASFVSQRRFYDIAFDADIAAALRKRADDLMFGTYSLTAPPPAEGKMEGGKECEYCPFYRKCTAHDVGCLPTDVRPLVDLDPVLVEEAHKLCRLQRDLKSRESELESTRKQTEAEIVDLLKKLDTKKIAAGWGSVSAYPQAGPPSFDYKKMETDGIDIEPYRRPPTVSPRINVSLKK